MKRHGFLGPSSCKNPFHLQEPLKDTLLEPPESTWWLRQAAPPRLVPPTCLWASSRGRCSQMLMGGGKNASSLSQSWPPVLHPSPPSTQDQGCHRLTSRGRHQSEILVRVPASRVSLGLTQSPEGLPERLSSVAAHSCLCLKSEQIVTRHSLLIVCVLDKRQPTSASEDRE